MSDSQDILVCSLPKYEWNLMMISLMIPKADIRLYLALSLFVPYAKTFSNSLYLVFFFLFFSFLTLFLDRLAKVISSCFIILYPGSVWPGLGLFIKHTGKCFCQGSLYCKMSGMRPWHDMCFKNKQSWRI